MLNHSTLGSRGTQKKNKGGSPTRFAIATCLWFRFEVWGGCFEPPASSAKPSIGVDVRLPGKRKFILPWREAGPPNSREVDVRLPVKRGFILPWREAGPPNHHENKVGSDH